MRASSGLRLGGSVIAVGKRESRLVQIGLQPGPPKLQLAPRHVFEHSALTFLKGREAFEGARHPASQVSDRGSIALVAVGRGLACTHERVVLRRQELHVVVQLAEMVMGPSEPCVVVRLQAPDEGSPKSSDASAQRCRHR